MTSPSPSDVFEDVLNLEDQYYREGYQLGVDDGTKSGRIEGRVFGLEKGLAKFLDMGVLNGRAAVWQARLPQPDDPPRYITVVDGHGDGVVPQLGANARLHKHVDRLAALSDPDDLTTANTEDSVSEFDHRLKDARAKGALIARIIGEGEDEDYSSDTKAEAADKQERGESSGETVLRIRRTGKGKGIGVAGRKTGEMEDFVGLPSRQRE
jgi:hypothetical protein